MKKLFLTGLLVVLTSVAFGQEPTNSSAKQAYTTLNTSLTKLQTLDPMSFAYGAELDKAKKKIDAIKQYEPNFDLTSKEKELQTYIDKKNAANSNAAEATVNQDEAINDANLIYKEMEALYKAPLERDFEDDVTKLAPDAQKRLDDYANSIQQFLDKGAAERVKKAKEIHRYRESKEILMEKSGFDVRLKGLLDATKNSTKPDHALISYYVIKKYEIYWNSLEIINPGDNVIATNAAMARKAASEVKAPEEIKKKVAENDQAYLATTKFPEAIRKDANLENVFKNVFNAQGWKESILKIHLVDSDWHIERNQYTGVILGRYQSAAIAVKTESGECTYYLFTIIQDYNGSSYQSTARRYSHSPYRLACENVN